MGIITRVDLETLCQEQAGICVSIYMPTYPKATETDQERILLKNLLAEAEKQLLAISELHLTTLFRYSAKGAENHASWLNKLM